MEIRVKKTYQVNAKEFAYDGCHKIYLIESEEDKKHATELEYEILPIDKLKETWENSCGLRFISNWNLTKHYVCQFEEANIV